MVRTIKAKRSGHTEVLRAPGTTLVKSLAPHHRKVMIGVPTLGTIRIEWDIHRRGQVIPINWVSAEITANHLPPSIIAQGYNVADAQNTIVERVILDGFQWCLLWEDDLLPPFDLLVRMDAWMLKGDVPIVSGLYYSRGEPSWPMTFRGRGNGAYFDFMPGKDLVWCDGVATGMLLIHLSILKWLWDHSPDYALPDGRHVREVFKIPRSTWQDPETDSYFASMGTSDLAFCDRVIQEEVLEKTGWKAVAKRKYPFLVDTRILCQHIDLATGIRYPAQAKEVLIRRGAS